MNRSAEPYRKLTETVNGFQLARALQVAVEWDVFTRVADEAKSAVQLANALGADRQGLEILLNALVPFGFLRKEAERFQATPLSQTYLVRGAPRDVRDAVRLQARRWALWQGLADAVRAGPKPRAASTDEADWDAVLTTAHEVALASGEARALVRAIGLGRTATRLVQVGGPGTHAALFCHVHPNLQATLVERSPALRVARRLLRDVDPDRRVTTVARDIARDAIPGAPYDVAVLPGVLHDENGQTNAALLHRVYAALAPGGAVIVQDIVMRAEHTEPDGGALLALERLLMGRGRAYAFAEFATWMRNAGFRDPVELPSEPGALASTIVAIRPGAPARVTIAPPAARLVTARATPVRRDDEDEDGRAGNGRRRPTPRRGANRSR